MFRLIAVALAIPIMLRTLWFYFSHFFKRNVFSLVLILILFSCGGPQLETILPFAYQNQGWT
jgi:hypothetical protein